MPYTSAEQVSLHLSFPFSEGQQIANQRLVMQGNDYLRFYSQAVVGTSVKVKAIQTTDLTRTTATVGVTGAQLPDSPIAPGSVIVAADSSLGTIFTENVDYIVDATEGRVIPKDGGLLAAGMTIVVWYFPFHIYTEGNDYALDARNGSVRRLASGDIANGETVYLDFQSESFGLSGELIDYAVSLANGVIEREIDPDGQFEADSMLNAAATYRALEIVCRSSAIRELASLRGEDRIAGVWMKLAEEFSGEASMMISNFKPPAKPYRSPQTS